MAEVQTSTWSETAASNNAATPNGWPEGMSYAAVNDCAREMMAALKREWNRAHPTVTSGGTSTALTLTYTTAPSAYVAGMQFAFIVGTANGASATLNVNSLGAVTIKKPTLAGLVALYGGELAANNIAVVQYDGTQMVLVGAHAGQVTSDASGNTRLPDVAGGPVGGFRNRVINGGFTVNQNPYVTNTALAAGFYGHDQWVAGSGGCTYTFTQVYPDTAITITAGTLAQYVEDRVVEGGSYTLSWTGTATGRIVASGASLSGSYAASPITIAGATKGQQISIEFGTGTLGKVQLEPGAYVTPFERRDFDTELRFCQRYYALVDVTGLMYPTVVGTLISVCGVLPRQMRAAPTLTSVATIYSDNNITSFTLDRATVRSFRAYAAATSTTDASFSRTIACNARL